MINNQQNESLYRNQKEPEEEEDLAADRLTIYVDMHIRTIGGRKWKTMAVNREH
jgi:hypothetical protein